ncbi:hypothetical protein H2200_009314 [Cladophialophora chaetospira]|uniref:Transcription factor domain-containing protein n=1 Tax=Cladophialophora chaetospira TaxID=386627 RepID=A0AA39CF93_9EURO|nr:hypothetical protein H2200_009314 [Cladophialophora chaetospira]
MRRAPRLLQTVFSLSANESKAELVREIQRIRGAVENPEAIQSQQTPVVEPPFINVFDGVPQTDGNSTTTTLGQNRSIAGAEITVTKINDCFSLFFTHYSPQVPVVDRPATPDAIFEKSPLLFWTVVTIGSRKYNQDPTVCSQLCHRIADLAFQSLKSRQTPIQIVQALVLLFDGLPPTTLIDAFQPDWADHDGTTAGPSQLALRTKLHHIQSSAICKITSNFMATPDDGVLQALIEMFDAQARMLQLQLHDEIDILTLYCTRLHICVSRFMLKQTDVSPTGFIDLYGISTSLIEKFAELDTATDLASYSTFYLSRALGLAAFVILKLHRSSLGLTLDRARGESCYFTAIRLYKKRSLLTSFNADLESKLAVILTELWSSSIIFRTNEGNLDSMSVRVRSRLTMNVFFDCLWWWRQEFRGQPDPFGASSQAAAGSLPLIDPFAVFPDIFTYDENYFGMYDDTFPVRDFSITS